MNKMGQTKTGLGRKVAALMEERDRLAAQSLVDGVAAGDIANALQMPVDRVRRISQELLGRLHQGAPEPSEPGAPKWKPTRERLLEEYADKPVRHLVQMDGWLVPGGGDDVMRPDEDGDTLFCRETYELRDSPEDLAVRIFFPYGTPKEDALRLLGKLQDWAAKDWEGVMYHRLRTQAEDVTRAYFRRLDHVVNYTCDCGQELVICEQNTPVAWARPEGDGVRLVTIGLSEGKCPACSADLTQPYEGAREKLWNALHNAMSAIPVDGLREYIDEMRAKTGLAPRGEIPF